MLQGVVSSVVRYILMYLWAVICEVKWPEKDFGKHRAVFFRVKQFGLWEYYDHLKHQQLQLSDTVSHPISLESPATLLWDTQILPYTHMLKNWLKYVLWDTAGLLVNDNYSTPTVNNIYCSSSCTGSNIQRVLERCALASQAEVH